VGKGGGGTESSYPFSHDRKPNEQKGERETDVGQKKATAKKKRESHGIVSRNLLAQFGQKYKS